MALGYLRDRMRCSRSVSKAKRQLWRGWGADALKFALIGAANWCGAITETHFSCSSLARVIPERLMLVPAVPAVGRSATGCPGASAVATRPRPSGTRPSGHGSPTWYRSWSASAAGWVSDHGSATFGIASVLKLPRS